MVVVVVVVVVVAVVHEGIGVIGVVGLVGEGIVREREQEGGSACMSSPQKVGLQGLAS